MADLSGIDSLAERRRLLLERSQQLREDIAADLQNLRPVASWVEKGYSVALSVYSFWPVVGGLAGFFVARKKGSLLGKVTKLWSVWRVGKRMLGMFKGPSPPQEYS